MGTESWDLNYQVPTPYLQLQKGYFVIKEPER
jgi:hypothetical protein